MLYTLFKAAHLFLLFAWIGGMVAVALALKYPALIHMQSLKTYDRTITTPAMILALLFGILLGIHGGWFSTGWLGLKILLVLVLSGFHGALVGKLRRAIQQNEYDLKPDGQRFLAIGASLLSAIVILVTTKPF